MWQLQKIHEYEIQLHVVAFECFSLATTFSFHAQSFIVDAKQMNMHELFLISDAHTVYGRWIFPNKMECRVWGKNDYVLFAIRFWYDVFEVGRGFIRVTWIHRLCTECGLCKRGMGLVRFGSVVWSINRNWLSQWNCYLYVYEAFFGAFEIQSIRILRDVLRREICVSLVNVNFACFVYIRIEQLRTTYRDVK